LRCADSRCPAAVAADCERWAREVEADLPTVRIRVTDARGDAVHDVAVDADGVRLSAEQLAGSIVLEAGPHTLRFEAPGFDPLVLTRALRPTDREVDVHAVLAPPAPPTASAAPRHGVPTASWVLAGVGAVALGTSLYFGLDAKSRYDDLKASCAPNCASGDADDVRRRSLVADVALVTSLAAFGAAAFVYFGSRSEPAAAAWYVAPRPDGAASGVRVSF
jgi:hypothetical protein